eukprot:4843599-Karenia_brevis.AAC.1
MIRQLMTGKVAPRVANMTGSAVGRGKGVGQGRAQSMIQFVLSLVVSLSGLIERWQSRGWGFPLPLPIWLGMLDYADDIVLCAASVWQLQRMIDELQQVLAPIGLQLGSKKDKVSWTIFDVSWKSDEHSGIGEIPHIRCGGSSFPQSDSLKLLKVNFSADGSLEGEATRRVGVGSACFSEVKSELTNKKASLSKRCNLLNPCVGNAMAWAAEAFPPSLFKMLGKKWREDCDAYDFFVNARKQAKKALHESQSGDIVKQ